VGDEGYVLQLQQELPDGEFASAVVAAFALIADAATMAWVRDTREMQMEYNRAMQRERRKKTLMGPTTVIKR
jgi:hypothetical protein